MLIIKFLINSFVLYFYDDIVSPDFIKINDAIYFKDENSKVNNGFLGFFDWLRINESKIVGVRICFLENQPYNEILKQLFYVTPSFEDKCMEIQFTGNGYSSELSGDQDFDNNFVYKSADNSYLFTFGLDHLNEQEKSSLLECCEILNKLN
jgi:hypothetical protein